MRKIVQIAVSTTNDTDLLYALCDDGSVFVVDPLKEKDEWILVQPIPE